MPLLSAVALSPLLCSSSSSSSALLRLRLRHSFHIPLVTSSSHRRPLTPPLPASSRPTPLSSSASPPTLLESFGTTSSSSLPARDMERCILVLCGKSGVEKDFARKLKEKKLLKLLDRECHEEIATDVRANWEADDDGNGPITSFGVESYVESLNTVRFGRLLIWTPLITSTHDLLHQNFGELPIGTVCLADAQSKGRGRVSNGWESPAGCLMFSYTVQMDNGRVLPLLQYVISLAVTEAIKDLCRERNLPHLDLKIKWPNDIYLNGLKVAGISCNSTYRSGKFNVSAGVGLNLDNKKPTTCLNAVLKELSPASCQLKREDILSAFFNKFEELFESFLNQGFAVLEDMYYKTWLHSGQKVAIVEKLEDQSTEETFVTVQGLTSSGYLLAADDDNNAYELHPDGNSFDFFKGLVRKKLG